MTYLISFTISLLLILCCEKFKVKYFFYYLSLSPVIIVAALRDKSIGVDTQLYVYLFFQSMKDVSSLKTVFFNPSCEELYTTLNFLVSRFTRNFNTYLFFAHSLMYGTALYSLYLLRNRIHIWIGAFILFFFFYRDSLNIARQSLAICILLISFVYLIRNNYFKSIILILIAYGFHHTSVIFLSLVLLRYLVVKCTYFFNKVRIKSLAVAIILLLLSFFSIIVTYLSQIGFISEKYVERYSSSDTFGTNIPISAISLSIVNLLAFYSIKSKVILKGRYVDLVFFEYIFIISLMCCFLGSISTFAVRIGDYFGYLSIIIIPILYSQYKYNSMVKTIHLLFYIFYWFMTVVVVNISKTYPYKSIFEF